jgi:hypothetical protein
MIAEEFKLIKSDPAELRKFGITMAVALALLGGLLLWRGRPLYPYLLAAAALFLGTGLTVPAILRPVHKAWMMLAVVMGWFMTRIILIVLFYGIITPLGLCARLCGKDFIGRKLDKQSNSYWIPRGKTTGDKRTYEKQF